MLSEPETARRAWTRLSRSLTEQRALGKRTCSKCKKLRAPDEFYRRPGRHSWCKQCENVCKRAWRLANLERARATDAAYRRRIRAGRAA